MIIDLVLAIFVLPGRSVVVCLIASTLSEWWLNPFRDLVQDAVEPWRDDEKT